MDGKVSKDVRDNTFRTWRGTRRGVKLEAITLTCMCTRVDGEYHLPRQRNEGGASGTRERMS